jgi:hypothetical protein
VRQVIDNRKAHPERTDSEGIKASLSPCNEERSPLVRALLFLPSVLLRSFLRLCFGALLLAGSTAALAQPSRPALLAPLPSAGHIVLGEKLGSGGTKDVYAVTGRRDLVLCVLKPGRPELLALQERARIQKLRAAGLPTVSILGTTSYEGRPVLIEKRYAQGSKEIVKLVDGRVCQIGRSELLNKKSIEDLSRIRRALRSGPIKIDDLQFLIDADGSMVISDPKNIEFGAPPSHNNLRMLELLIQAARSNRHQPHP